jgi:O-antigen ligase
MSALRLPRPSLRSAISDRWWLGCVVVGALGGVVIGREVSHGHAALIALALGGGLCLLWTLASATTATLALIVALPFLIYPTSTNGLSLFAAVPLAGIASIGLLLAQHGSLPRLRRGLSLGAFALVLLAAVVATGRSSHLTTAGSRLIYLVMFGLFAWAIAAAIAAGALTVRQVAEALCLSAALASIALIIQVVAQFGAGKHAVITWLVHQYGLFGGQRGAGIAHQQQNWNVNSVNIVRGIFPFMAAPSAGQYTMMGLVTSVWLWRQPATVRRSWRRRLYLVAIVLTAVALLATFSRQAWVGAFIGVGALSLRGSPVRSLLIIGLLFLVFSVTPVPGNHTTFGDYLLTASDTTSTSSGTRLGLWSQALHLIPHHWVIGVGPGLIGTLNPDPNNPVYYAHNVWLDETVELGVVGGAALILTFVIAMRHAFRRGAHLGFALLAAYAVANLFDDVLFFPRNGFMLSVAFALAAGGAVSSSPNRRARHTSSSTDTARRPPARLAAASP